VVEAAWAGEVKRRLQAYEMGGATVLSAKEPRGDEKSKP